MIKSISTLTLWVSCVVFTQAQVQFVNMAEGLGLTEDSQSRGVSFCDFDKDGDQDIFFSNVNEPNVLYENMGDNSFVNVTENSGVGGGDAYSISGVWADYDNDGWIDLYVGNLSEPNVLYKNNGDGTFTDVTDAMGVGDDGAVRSVMWADVNLDGYVDLYVANMNEENKMYMSQSAESFIDLVYYSQTTDTQVAQGAMFFDYDNDGDADLYLTHDAYQPFILYDNDGEGIFSNVSVSSGSNYAAMGMGVDCGDYNRDGNLDIYFTLMGENALLSNNGDGTFSEISSTANVVDMGMGWGTFFLDYDNDGWEDIYVSNDSFYSPLSNVMYHNNGDSTFTNVSSEVGVASMLGGWGAASADVNNDGWLDVAVANSGIEGFNELLINSGGTGHWIGISLEGVISNYCAIGARVEVYDESGVQIDEVSGGASFASQNSMRLHFGLAASQSVDSVVVRWPSGLVESWTDVEVDAYNHLIEGESSTEDISIASLPEIRIFPNPCSAIVKISAQQIESVLVLDAFGREMLTFDNKSKEKVVELDLSPFPAGMYWLLVDGRSFPLIKQ